MSLAEADVVNDASTVHAIDMGFPMMITVVDSGIVKDEHRIALCVIPDEQERYVFAAWSSGTGNGPELVMLEEVQQIETLSRQNRVIHLSDGREVHYKPSRKCGCGSRLRSFRPFGTAVRMASTQKPSIPWTKSSDKEPAL
jgi:hypothetical protein